MLIFAAFITYGVLQLMLWHCLGCVQKDVNGSEDHVASFELCSTLNENLGVLRKDQNLMDAGKVQTLSKTMEPLALLMQQFHKDSPSAHLTLKVECYIVIYILLGNIFPC